ncbi:MAG: hypothetical protein KDC54_08225 [Lewinella sp.]|nr:hypothetical protein [Lewinella sp.]
MEDPFFSTLFANQYDRTIKQIMLSAFCLLTSIILWYFFLQARQNPRARPANVRGLLFLSLAFVAFFLLGTTEALFKQGSLAVLLSGLANVFLILSLPFFSKGVTVLDRVALQPFWYAMAGQLVLIYGLSILFPQQYGIDVVLSSLTLAVFGVYLTSFFYRKQLRFIALLAGLSVLTLIALQILAELNVSGGKFRDINVAVLYPALFLSMTILIVTFNWINELRFKELAKIYTSGVDKDMIEQFLNGQLDRADLIRDWESDISQNHLEAVIEEMVMVKERRNESLEDLLLLAARNSRNNNARHVNGTISEEAYILERNKIIQGITFLFGEV